MLLWDDIDDLGYFTYFGRKNHVYHGKPSPDHPSPFHHWQWAGWFMLVGELLAYADVAKELQAPDEETVPPTKVFDV